VKTIAILDGKYSAIWLFGLCLTGACSPQAPLRPIIYTSWGQLLSVSPDGRAGVACGRIRAEVKSPSWSPSGAMFAAEIGSHDGPSRLAILDDRCRIVRYLEDSTDFIRPTWSPDGLHIVALSYSLGRAVRRWDVNGGIPSTVQISGYEHEYAFPQGLSYGPSGARAVILSDRFERFLVVKAGPGAFEVVRVVARDFEYVAQAAWLDEHNIVFVGRREGDETELWMLDIDGDVTERIGIDGLWLRDYVALSPDRQSAIVCGVTDPQVQ